MIGFRYRFALLACTAGVFLAAGISGCGSGSGRSTTVNTGSGGGSLVGMEITPSPGSTFISKSTTFQLSWPNSNPPDSFDVSLKRYKETGSTDGSESTEIQKTDLKREGSSNVWDLHRSDNFDMDSPGVYYIEVDNGDEQVLASYIVSADSRAAARPRDTPDAAATNIGGVDTARVHLVSR